MSVEMRDVAPGLWLWRQPHPDWREGFDWEREVTSFAKSFAREPEPAVFDWTVAVVPSPVATELLPLSPSSPHAASRPERVT